MKVEADLRLGTADNNELARILGCKPTELGAALSPYASAALEELVTMFLGQKVFSRGSDLLEYRLFLLIRHAFKGRIPDEQEVCRLFQATSTGSRSLIRAVMSKYQYQLKSAIDGTLGKLLDAAEAADDEEPFTVAVHSLNLVEELNRELAEIDTNLPPVQKKRGSVSTFEIQPSSYSRLCKRFKIEPKTTENDE